MFTNAQNMCQIISTNFQNISSRFVATIPGKNYIYMDIFYI